jgi:hypothetical protein
VHRLPDPRFDRVAVRGRSYLAPEPLRFDDPSLEPTRPERIGYTEVRPYVGFRVVLEVPPATAK